MRPKFVYFAIALLLGGCAAPMASTPIEVSEPVAYAADVNECQAAAANYRPRISGGAVAYGALSGALGSVAYAPINGLIPALGAAGGAANAAAAPFDLTGNIRANVFRHCLSDKVNRDRSAIIANPDN